MTTAFEIREVRALVRRPRCDEAQQLLARIAAHVLPILTQRRFRVLRLQEFFPANAHLLGMNVNRGYKIYLRLRPAAQPASFYPFEALLETMLHELAHMVHGPHNQVFYKYLDELKTEMEALMIRGLIGAEGAKFHSAGDGRVIDAPRSIPVRFENDNAAAVLAAKRRALYQQLLGSQTSHRLGGGNGVDLASSHMTPDQLQKKMLKAAERRRQDNERCTVAETLLQSIEVLGIDDSDEDDKGQEADAQSVAVIDLVECVSSPNPPVLLVPVAVQATAAVEAVVIVDLVNEDDEEQETKTAGDDVAALHTNRVTRKRKLGDAAADTIDLTADD